MQLDLTFAIWRVKEQKFGIEVRRGKHKIGGQPVQPGEGRVNWMHSLNGADKITTTSSADDNDHNVLALPFAVFLLLFFPPFSSCCLSLLWPMATICCLCVFLCLQSGVKLKDTQWAGVDRQGEGRGSYCSTRIRFILRRFDFSLSPTLRS